MNALTTTHHAPSALVPRDMGQAMTLADMMARSSLVPQHLQGKPADCLLVIEQAMRWQMSPFAVAQASAIVRGKLCFEGKVMHAAVEQNAPLASRLNYHFEGEGPNRAVIVSATLRGETEPRTVRVVYKDAATANDIWKRQPDQQLCYHGARVWARRHTPEVIFGAYSREEMPAVLAAAAEEGEAHVVGVVVPDAPAIAAPSPMDNPNAMQSFTLSALDDQLAQFWEVEELNSYLNQEAVQKAKARAERAGRGDKWQEIVSAHYARVMPERDGADTEAGAGDAE